VRNESFWKGILSVNNSFQGGGRLILFQIGLFTYAGEINVSLEKPSVLAAGASSTLFPSGNILVLERNTSCNPSVSRWK
jgi:hypothetical protein